MTTSPDTICNFPALAAGLCQDGRIGLRYGRNWSFDPLNRIIEVNEQHVAQEPELSLGLLAHEASHVWITRYNNFAPGPLGRPLWAPFMNGLEDPRANGWIQLRYPGTAPWFETMYAFDRKTPVSSPSRFLSWVAAVSIADAYGWSETTSWIVDQPAACEAFARTSDARRRYALEVPPADLATDVSVHRLKAAYLREVEPELESAAPLHGVDAAERQVLLSAARARAIAVTEILPQVRGLIEDDERAIGSFLAHNPTRAEALEFGLRQHDDEVLPIIDQALRSPIDGALDGEAKLARWAFEHYVAQRGSSPGFGDGAPIDEAEAERISDRALRGRRRRRRRSAASVDPDGVTATVHRQLPSLVRDLETVLQPSRARRPRSGYASGKRLDMRRVMAHEADRRGYDQLWVRPQRSGRPMAAVSLLVDLSGSMQGKKIAAATIGTLLLAEALDRLGHRVRYAVTGFQDELIPFITFGQALTPAARRSVLDMHLETYGDRPDGWNRPNYNDDAPCLAEAAEILRHQPGQKIIIVVSDGSPAGRRSNGDDLHEVVARLTVPMADLTLFGLGLGPGTDHMTEYYPNAIANIPVDEFAAGIAGLLKRVLVQSFQGARR